MHPLQRDPQPGTSESDEPIRHRDVVDQPPQEIRTFEICREHGISDETWMRWRKSGKAPLPIATPGWPRWNRAEITEFFERRKQAALRRTFFGSAVRRRSA